MARKLGRPKAGQEVLTRSRIIAAALRLVDDEGIEGLSMRRLATELGVDPMAIYHHMPNKQALIGGITDHVFSELRLPAPDDRPWQEHVELFAQAYRDLIRAHPQLGLHLTSSMGAGSPALLAANEALYAALTRAGLPPRRVVQAADLIVDYLNGWALASGRNQAGPPGGPHSLPDLVNQHPPERYPTLAATFARLGAQERQAASDDGLGVILAGIAALAAEGRPGQASPPDAPG